MLPCAELFKNELDSKNLHYGYQQIDDNAVNISFPYGGKVVNCIFSGDAGEYLSLYLTYETVPEEKIADLIFLCNELNTTYKWVTFFVDKSCNLVLHDDAILSLESAVGEAFELLLHIISIGDKAKPVIMKTIYG